MRTKTEPRLPKVVNEFDEPVEQTITWELRATEHAKGITMTMKCCLCRQPLLKGKGGWCEHCQTWPINITPIRRCERNHLVGPDGWCHGCNDFIMTSLEPRNAQWIDTRIVPNRLGKEKIKAFVAEVAATLSMPGWPDKAVPLRRDRIPRSWKRQQLRIVGTTPLGYDIVLPEERV